MRLLVITRAPWKNDNGTGNTLTDFFSELEDAEIFSISMRETPEVCPIPQKNFYFSENQFIQKIVRNKPVGKITENKENKKDTSSLGEEEKLYNIAKKADLMIFTFCREILWDMKLWKNERLDSFLQEAHPDVIFFPNFPCIYAHKVFAYIVKKTGARAIMYHADDCYTLKQFSLSPLYWGYRFALRRWVRNSVRISQAHYVISDVQKNDYDRMFGINHKILTKFSDFTAEPNIKEIFHDPLKIVYTGNIGINRWRSLGLLAKTLKRINQE